MGLHVPFTQRSCCYSFLSAGDGIWAVTFSRLGVTHYQNYLSCMNKSWRTLSGTQVCWGQHFTKQIRTLQSELAGPCKDVSPHLLSDHLYRSTRKFVLSNHKELMSAHTLTRMNDFVVSPKLWAHVCLHVNTNEWLCCLTKTLIWSGLDLASAVAIEPPYECPITTQGFWRPPAMQKWSNTVNVSLNNFVNV